MLGPLLSRTGLVSRFSEGALTVISGLFLRVALFAIIACCVCRVRVLVRGED